METLFKSEYRQYAIAGIITLLVLLNHFWLGVGCGLLAFLYFWTLPKPSPERAKENQRQLNICQSTLESDMDFSSSSDIPPLNWNSGFSYLRGKQFCRANNIVSQPTSAGEVKLFDFDYVLSMNPDIGIVPVKDSASLVCLQLEKEAFRPMEPSEVRPFLLAIIDEADGAAGFKYWVNLHCGQIRFETQNDTLILYNESQLFDPRDYPMLAQTAEMIYDKFKRNGLLATTEVELADTPQPVAVEVVSE